MGFTTKANTPPRLNVSSFSTLISVISGVYFFYAIFLSDYFITLPSYGKELIAGLLFAITTIVWSEKGGSIREHAPSLFWLGAISYFSAVGVIVDVPDPFSIRHYVVPLFFFWLFRFWPKGQFEKTMFSLVSIYLWLVLVVAIREIIRDRTDLIHVLLSSAVLDRFKVERGFLFFVIPNIAGGTIASLMLLGVALSKGLVRPATGRIIATGIVPLVYTFSRTAIIAIGLYFTAVFYGKACWRLKLLILALVLVGVPAAGPVLLADQAMGERLEYYTETIIPQLTVWGHGIGHATVSRFSESRLIFDSDIFRFFYEVGFFGMFLFLVFLGSCINKENWARTVPIVIFMLASMTVGDFHSMYPIPAIVYSALGYATRHD